jgi:hypothetical protein
MDDDNRDRLEKEHDSFVKDIRAAHNLIHHNAIEISGIKARQDNHEMRLVVAEGRLMDHYKLLVDMRGDISLLKSEQKQMMDIVCQTQEDGKQTQISVKEALSFLHNHAAMEEENQVKQTKGIERLSRNLIFVGMTGILILFSLSLWVPTLNLHEKVKALLPFFGL